jgi:hypothetical protein
MTARFWLLVRVDVLGDRERNPNQSAARLDSV